jgi:hypothetical protein
MFMYRIRAIRGFSDGNVYPRRVHVDEEIIVNEMTFKKMKASDPDSIELIEKLVPNPKKAKKDGDA